MGQRGRLNGQSGKDDDGNGYKDDIYGYNFVTNTKLAISTQGEAGEHGTHVAGTVAAVNNNGIGVCGIAGGSGNNDGVKLMSCQIFYNGNGGNASTTANAIKYAADNGAVILQCSWGYTAGTLTSALSQYSTYDSAEKQAIDYFISKKNCAALDGGIAIFAAGNDMTGMSGYPAAYRDYISVTAMSCDFTPAYYTNYGPGCNIAAPGGDYYQSGIETGSEASMILSTILNGRYGYSQGTSMACPHVSGVAALGLSYALQLGKTFTTDQFKALLLTSVNNIDQYCTGTKPYYDNYGSHTLNLAAHNKKMGTGYIDAFQVLMNVRGTTCIPVPVGSQYTLDLAALVGGGNANMTITSVEISAEGKASLGMTSDPRVFANQVLLTCTKPGSAIAKVTMVAGTNSGSGINGMTITKEYAIIAREFESANGGWL